MRYSIRYILSSATCFCCLYILYIFFGYQKSNSHEDISKGMRTTTWDKILSNSELFPSISVINNNIDIEGLPRQPVRQHLIDYLDFPTRADPYNFRECRMSTCFNISRCLNQRPIKIHILKSRSETVESTAVGENNIIHQNMVSILQRSKHYEPDPDKACILIPGEDTLDRDPLSTSFQPKVNYLFSARENYGMNHLVFNLYSGSWPDYAEDDFADIHMNAAIIAKASAGLTHHRPNYDISIPLFSNQYPLHDNLHNNTINSSISYGNRTFLLTFKGKRYVFGRGSETRNSLYHIDNGKDVLMLSTCRHGKNWQDSVDNQCTLDEEKYGDYDFVDLIKRSKFCLIPRGRRLGSYRFLEALQYGCIPVIMSNGWIKPFDELIDWSRATLQFDERLILQVPDLLRDIKKTDIEILRRNGRLLYDKYVSTVEKILLTTIGLIERRIDSLISNSSQ